MCFLFLFLETALAGVVVDFFDDVALAGNSFVEFDCADVVPAIINNNPIINVNRFITNFFPI